MVQSNQSKSKTLKGVVVATKMQDTIVVSVDRYVQHPKYRKYLRHSKRYKVHNPGTTPSVGEKVVIVACRPVSKEKRFCLVEAEKK